MDSIAAWVLGLGALQPTAWCCWVKDTPYLSLVFAACNTKDGIATDSITGPVSPDSAMLSVSVLIYLGCR